MYIKLEPNGGKLINKNIQGHKSQQLHAASRSLRDLSKLFSFAFIEEWVFIYVKHVSLEEQPS